MAKRFDRIEDDHKRFIEDQHLFFTGSAGPEGRVNISPKGMDSLRVMGPNRILWMNITGSGNETAGHLLENPRMTLMWCSFSKRPLILRCYGTATATHVGDAGWKELAGHFPAHRSARQIFDLTVDLVQTSCGYAVPFMDFAQDRDTMQRWVDDKSDADIRAYWIEKNTRTIDGKPTGVPLSD
ncbi:MAG: pyridoxamine 5'-phosphate oxidase family protein [Rhodobacteraceae bacterium]|nr:pyridoxamine 5'-phosphate oxidase family protein [Paracoccaceae bacterium]